MASQNDDDQEYVGANPTQVMFHAIQAANTALLLEILASEPRPNFESSNAIGDTPVLACLRHDSVDALALILEEAVDVDLGNRARDGDRPLHLAIRVEDDDRREWCVRNLLEAGSDPHLTNSEGLKPIDLLSTSERDERVRWLLRESEAVNGVHPRDVVDVDDDTDGGTPSDEE